MTEVNAGLVELIKEAFTIRNQFLSGPHDSIEAMSGRLGMNKGRLTSLVRLSYLGPEIVRARGHEDSYATCARSLNRERVFSDAIGLGRAQRPAPVWNRPAGVWVCHVPPYANSLGDDRRRHCEIEAKRGRPARADEGCQSQQG
jgi:hypothetical protein